VPCASRPLPIADCAITHSLWDAGLACVTVPLARCYDGANAIAQGTDVWRWAACWRGPVLLGGRCRWRGWDTGVATPAGEPGYGAAFSRRGHVLTHAASGCHDSPRRHPPSVPLIARGSGAFAQSVDPCRADTCDTSSDCTDLCGPHCPSAYGASTWSFGLWGTGACCACTRSASPRCACVCGVRPCCAHARSTSPGRASVCHPILANARAVFSHAATIAVSSATWQAIIAFSRDGCRAGRHGFRQSIAPNQTGLPILRTIL